MDHLAQLSAREDQRAVKEISEREKEVPVARGLTNRELAETLVISENTARNHVSRIPEKLSLSRRSEAATFAAKHGLLGEEIPGQDPGNASTRST